jgi:hypothetical protein
MQAVCVMSKEPVNQLLANAKGMAFKSHNGDTN